MGEMSLIEHDLLVIGGGPGGYVAAIRAAQLGLNTACVEQEQALGGTCLRVGCIPSKALLESSELVHKALSGFAEHGIQTSQIKLDVSAMMKRKESIVDGLCSGIAQLFKKHGVTRYQGHAKFDGPGKVIVETADGLVDLSAKHIIIATGSKPVQLPGVELDGDLIGSSTQGLSFTEVPERLAVIGAGVIGMELGSVWLRLGSQVTVLEYLDHILPGTDSEIVREAFRIYKKQGFEFRLKSRVTAARVEGKGKNRECVVEMEGAEPVRADRVLCVVGRIPNTDGLGLESTGIELDIKGRIVVGEHWRTSTEGVYAIGDVTPGWMLAHRAMEEGVACVEQIVNGYGHVNYGAIPSVVYTEPEIASVGQTEDELQATGMKEGVDYKKGTFTFRANGRARTLSSVDGKVKVLADAATDRILGVHIIGPRAGDLIAEALVAIEFGASSEDLGRICHAHPSLSEVMKEAALAVTGQPIHF
jgi:dihydrolipoamide dehydrogenase